MYDRLFVNLYDTNLLIVFAIRMFLVVNGKKLMKQIKMNEDKKPKSYKERIVLAFLAGAVIAICIALYGIQFVAKNINYLIALFLVMLMVIGIFILIIVFFKEPIFKTIFGISSETHKEIKDSIFNVYESYVSNDYEKSKESLSQSVNQFTAWYSWLSFRRWVVVTLSSFLLGFATLLGSALLYNQNELIKSQNKVIEIQTQLIENQNDRLDQQTYLMDSEMKKPLLSEVINLEKYIDDKIKEEDSISIETISLINKTIFSFRPYKYLDEKNDKLHEKAYSPEKSRIFLKLLTTILNESSWSRIKGYVTFNSIHIPNLRFLEKTDFSGIEMNGSNFFGSTCRECKFSNTKINACIFDECWLDNSNFEKSFAPNCNFKNSNLFYTNFKKAVLNDSNFQGADIYHAELDSASLSECDFRNADIHDITAKGANFSGAKAYKSQRFSFKESGLTNDQLNQIIWESKEEDLE